MLGDGRLIKRRIRDGEGKDLEFCYNHMDLLGNDMQINVHISFFLNLLFLFYEVRIFMIELNGPPPPPLFFPLKNNMLYIEYEF